MAQLQVVQKDVDALLKSATLVAKGNHHWKRSSNKNWCRADISVEINDPAIKDVKLRISISVSLAEPSKRDFVLLWNNISVRRLCINGSHCNRHTNAEKWIRQTHKHLWTDNCLDRFAYTPNDITANDVQGQLNQFCAECGITSMVTLAAVPVQEGLFDDM